MTEPEDLEEDLFADLYDGDDNTAPAPPAPTAATSQLPAQPMSVTNDSKLRNEAPAFGEEPDTAYTGLPFENNTTSQQTQGGNAQNGNQMSGHDQNHNGDDVHMDNEPFGSGIKEDGKMFIGGLNWETTDQSLRDYFSQFGEVQECTVMRDGATGRSRGFGFLTFKDAKTVNTVMVKEHYLDGKIIDPKRAIPRDEQEKTSKIFVGGVSQEATEQDFKEFFMQFGRVVDATLMMDKDTGRPRGFGFVTFDGEAAVDRCLEYHPLEILGKPIEVKKAQPRGKMGEEDDSARGGRGRGKFGRDDNRFGNDGGSQSNQGGQNGQAQGGMMGAGVGGMTPQMMAQYWQRMQQYFALMQQQMASAAMGGGMGAMAMGQMNPQLMAQMQQMQHMQQIQKMQNQQQGNMSPAPQSPGTQGMPNMANMQGMNPQMQQQMMQQMQMMQPGGMNNMNIPTGPSGAPTGPGMGANRPAYNAQEQLAFEQRKYEQQQARRAQMEQGGVYQNSSFAQQQGPQSGGATSWEGMYDDVPPPHNPNPGGRGSAGVVRNLTPSNAGPGKVPKGPATPQPSAAPANAPTGPKNAGVPGANFRNRGGRGGGGRFHPYGR